MHFWYLTLISKKKTKSNLINSLNTSSPENKNFWGLNSESARPLSAKTSRVKSRRAANQFFYRIFALSETKKKILGKHFYHFNSSISTSADLIFSLSRCRQSIGKIFQIFFLSLNSSRGEGVICVFLEC